MLELVCSRTQNFTIINQEKHKIKQEHLEPHDYRIYFVNIDLHHQCVELSVTEAQTFLLVKRP